jgi:hypothetical protein
MTVPRESDEAKHWRAIALEAFASANQMSDPESRMMMLCIAAGYDRLAEQAEEQARIERKLAERRSHDGIQR